MSITRVALVTGANRGIGLEIALQLARTGLIVVLGSRDEAAAEHALEVFRTEGLDAPVVPLDVSYAASVDAAFASIDELFGRLDILVNNAGILLDRDADGNRAMVADVAIDVVRATFEVNTIGALRTTKAALPRMRHGGYGRIVNISSDLGRLADMAAGMPAYRMSKAALNALTRTTAAELGDDDAFKVNAMAPGWVRTDMGGADADRSVEEGADTAVWLATLDNDGPTGGFFKDRKPIPW